jgi:hypothetical protein
MKKIIFFVMVFSLLISCKTKKETLTAPIVLENSDSTGVETKYVQLTADSAWFYAMIACDSNNNAILKQLNTGSTKGLQNNFSFSNGILSTKVVKPKDSISYQIIVRVISRSVPVLQPYPVEKELTKWQGFQIILGRIFMLILGIALGFGGLKLYKKLV